ncbi:ferric reductase-like transmembrane domain-containing protein [Tateyamaria sp. ANG-S1]|uniref:ferric reductase-like transmembrane domain-containing protein n=1 Tax=Tateyamaria sp. ANG-S1 TaxID=1577905 RepID=UPI00068D2DDC|nr:ferric reductase-like transmembrane domain-containing protein [Tateyamaria sp. ANG-S1]
MVRTCLIWAALVVALLAPIVAAAFSPLLQWREGIYIGSGFAGIIGMALILVQQLLAIGKLPGLPPARSRRIHRVTGVLLVLAVMGHVAGLWITSPPDVIDVLLFRSPTPFAVWGAIAMWAVFAAALVAALRKRLPIRLQNWRRLHVALTIAVAGGTVLHALQIQGTMEPVTKWILGLLILLAMSRILRTKGLWPRLPFGNTSHRTHR